MKWVEARKRTSGVSFVKQLHYVNFAETLALQNAHDAALQI